ncbi:TIGR04222 domain-containing membrane protein [Streptomyces sp. NPDC002896]|uniref:TIGR04222 domain-containing membrane protein n=1 Tax=Streptomyces sp. NPDC002896 TaxID=3154438 RepID=UPI00332C56DD
MNGLGPWLFTILAAAGSMAYLVVAGRCARLPRPSAPSGRAPEARGNALLNAAFLVGGPRRVANTVLVAMQRDGRLHISRDGRVTRAPGTPRNAVEGQIVGALREGEVATTAWLRGRVMRSAAVRDIGTALAEAGLLVEPALRKRITRGRRALVALLPVLFVVGFLLAGDDTAALVTATALLILMSGGLIMLFVQTSKRRLWCTNAGADRLADLRRAPASAFPGIDPVLAGVALLGLEQLSDPELQAGILGHGRPDKDAPGGSCGAGATCNGGGCGGTCCGGAGCGGGGCGGGGCGGN